jgi:hypothetical protein
MPNFHRLKWDHEILYDDRYLECKQLLIRLLCRKPKIWIHEIKNSLLVLVRQPMNRCTWTTVATMEDNGHTFIWIIIIFNWAFEYGDVGIIKLLRWLQNLHLSTWEHEIFLRWQIFKRRSMGGWMLKFTFYYFMERTNEPLYSEKRSSIQRKIMEISASFTWITTVSDAPFEYGGGSKFWGYVGTNAEPLCV